MKVKVAAYLEAISYCRSKIHPPLEPDLSRKPLLIQ